MDSTLLTPYELNICANYFTPDRASEAAASIAERMAKYEAQCAAELEAANGLGVRNG